MEGVNSKDLITRQFGLGAAPSQQGWQQACTCPFTQVPVLEYVTLTIPLPVQDTAITATFGDTINVLNTQGTPPGVVSVDSSFAINGILQTNMFVCGIGIHAFGEPISFSQMGNGVPTSITSLPVSADAWSTNDLTHAALGPTAAGSIVPADLEWGFADWNALWHMMNAYQFQWTFCQRYLLLNELAADVAYFGPYAEGEGMGTSEVAVQQYIKQVNSYYRANGGSVFLPIKYRRYGSVNVGATGAPTLTGNTGVFHPSNDWALAPVTFGGIKNQGSSGALPFRKMTKPIFLGAGLPIKMQLVAQDQYHLTQMQRYMSISEGVGNNVTALVQVDTTLNGTPAFTAPTAVELTLDQGGNQFASQSVNYDRQLYKGGVMKIAMLLKGFEVGGQWLGCFQGSQGQSISSQVYIPGVSGVNGVGVIGGPTGR
jgi:hypothetical protein